MDAEVFQSASSRATACGKAKPEYIGLDAIQIEADQSKKTVIFRSFNLNSSAEIYVRNVAVIYSGKANINLNDLKQLYKPQGEVCVSLEGRNLRVENGKKKCEVFSPDFELPDSPKAGIYEPSFIAASADFLDTMKRLSCCLDDKSNGTSRNPHNGYRFDVEKGRIITLNGYQLSFRKVDWFENADNYSGGYTVAPEILKELAQINSKKDEQFNGYFDNGNLFLYGSDFRYQIKLIDGDYLNVDFIFSKANYGSVFTVNLKNLCDISKEYADASKSAAKQKENRPPMFFFKKGDELISAIDAVHYRTSDVIEIEDGGDSSKFSLLADGALWAFNPLFLCNLKSILSDESVTVTANHPVSPNSMWIINGEDGYTCLTMPVKLRSEKVEEIQRFLNS